MAKHKILIVDDEKISLRMTQHILSSEYETVCATNGKDAIEIYKTERPDLVLSDLRMPKIDGFELHKKLQETYGKQIPFMFMTADKDDEAESKGFAIGALDFIRKPFRADVLLRRVSNILQNVEQIQGLQKAATTDPMTGLLNKASSQEEIDLLARTTPGALMMIDLDSFKPVNDIYGHAMGDKVLIRFAEIIRSSIRSTDIAGRIGGDEFVVFCKSILDEDVIADKAAYINEQIVLSAKELMGQSMTIPLGASIGCVFAPDEGADFISLYKKADKALYSVKQNGKHGYKVYREKKETSGTEENEATALKHAMALMAERSPGKGAFNLPTSDFKKIYHFLSRVIGNYHNTVHVILYSVIPIKKDVDQEEATEAFIEVVQMSLRQSDVITRYGTNQVMILLLKAISSDLEIVGERIAMNWESKDISALCKITREISQL
ncbi:MAG: diguanylate cyclase [Butyrivibrio sp.]|nr:diguanylate cyclase [Butyrivibrio sp.]